MSQGAAILSRGLLDIFIQLRGLNYLCELKCSTFSPCLQMVQGNQSPFLFLHLGMSNYHRIQRRTAVHFKKSKIIFSQSEH